MKRTTYPVFLTAAFFTAALYTLAKEETSSSISAPKTNSVSDTRGSLVSSKPFIGAPDCIGPYIQMQNPPPHIQAMISGIINPSGKAITPQTHPNFFIGVKSAKVPLLAGESQKQITKNKLTNKTPEQNHTQFDE